jgi:hypothetical protein
MYGKSCFSKHFEVELSKVDDSPIKSELSNQDKTFSFAASVLY